MARQRRSRLVGYTELRLNKYDNRARSRHQENSSGDSGWPATTAGIRMQGQANCQLDKPPDPGKQQRRLRRGGGYRQCQTNFRPQRSQCYNLMRCIINVHYRQCYACHCCARLLQVFLLDPQQHDTALAARISAANVKGFRQGDLVQIVDTGRFTNLLSIRAEVNSAPSSAIPGY